MMWINWALVAIGLLVVADGIGSVLIKSGQFHNAWFDGERWLRALAGIAIVGIGMIAN